MDPRTSHTAGEPARGTRLGLAGLVLLVPLLLACSAVPAAPSPDAEPPTNGAPGNPGQTDPDGVVVGPPMGDEPPVAGGATIVTPDDGLVDLRPVTWDRVEVSADGKTLTVYWYGGVETCYGLADVQVERRDDGTLAIGLWEGTRPEAVNQACIEIAMLKATLIELEKPIIVPLVGS
jgi:hypothetical protein